MDAVGAISKVLIGRCNADPLGVWPDKRDQLIAFGQIAECMTALFASDVFEVNGSTAMIAGKKLHGPPS
jgi:hypothetical protein